MRLIYKITLICFYIGSYLSIVDAEAWHEATYTDLALSPDGHYLLIASSQEQGFYLTDLTNKKSIKLSGRTDAAYRATWSKDSRFVGFKTFVQHYNRWYQIPAVYDVHKKKIIHLSQPLQRAGIPSFSDNNRIAYTLGESLIVTNRQRKILYEYDLGSYVNQARISPNGERVLYNDTDDAIWLLTLSTGQRERLNIHPLGCFNPTWSPDGKFIILSSLTSDIIVYSLSNGDVINYGKGIHPVWVGSGNTFLFSRLKIIETVSVEDIVTLKGKAGSAELKQEMGGNLWADYITISSTGTILFLNRKNNTVYQTDLRMLNNNSLSKQSPQLREIDLDIKHSAEINNAATFSLNTPSVVASEKYFDIPYIHQRYDTPDHFNGDWACGATAAVMCLTYYELLEKWPVTVSIPYSHVSDYGNYISEIYSYNNYTFDIYALDPDGNKGYGGYGFIVRHGDEAWSDTKGNMAEYARKHGLSSYVDWSPSRSKLIGEADSRMPMVMLTSLTSAGHYVSVIGYEGQQATTIIVNDPWGDKNYGYPNFYGKHSKYDWPGYSNGYANLNTVWCYIYFRGPIPNYPDLEVHNEHIISDTLYTGGVCPIYPIIKNIGNVASKECSGNYYFISNTSGTNDKQLLKTVRLPVIQPGDSISLSDNIQLPDSLVSRNDYKITFEVKPDSAQHELNLSNNSTSQTLIIIGYPEIYGPYPEDNSFVSNRNLSIGAKFKNFVSPLVADSIHLFLNNEDLTSESSVSVRKIEYTAHVPLSYGAYNVRVEAVNQAGYRSILRWKFTLQPETAIREDGSQIPGDFSLRQNYPNPFNSTTHIRFGLPKTANVTFTIYDISGKKIKSYYPKNYSPGFHTLIWEGDNTQGETAATGIYIIVMQTAQRSLSRRMLLLK